MRIAVALIGLFLVFTVARPSEAAFIRSFEVSGSGISPSFEMVDPFVHGIFEGDFSNQVVFSVRNTGFFTAQFEVTGPDALSYLSPVIGFGALEVFVGPVDLAGDYSIRAYAFGGLDIFNVSFADAVLAPPPPPPPSSGVPAPGALALIGLGLLGFGLRRKTV